MEDHDIRAALDRHWAASDANDFEAEHQIYREDAGARVPAIGRAHPRPAQHSGVSLCSASKKALRTTADTRRCDLWITEFVITYDARPSYTVSIMEFRDGKVARETQYFGDPFEPGPSRAQWVERMR